MKLSDLVERTMFIDDILKTFQDSLPIKTKLEQEGTQMFLTFPQEDIKKVEKHLVDEGFKSQRTPSTNGETFAYKSLYANDELKISMEMAEHDHIIYLSASKIS